MDQEQQPSKQIAGDRLLKTLGIDPNKWTVGDRRIALLGIGIGLTIVIIAVCGYVFEWGWTGLTKPQQRTFWDWLSLLIVPIVLALGGYLFNRSESRRTKDDAERQRTADRQIADQRAQDEALQAYLAQMSQLLLDRDRPLRQSEEDDEVRIVARARTLTVLTKLDGGRKGVLLRFLYESGLLNKDTRVVEISGADLSNADLSSAALSDATMPPPPLSGLDLSSLDSRRRSGRYKMLDLSGINLSYANLNEANLVQIIVRGADLSNAQLKDADLEGTWLDEADLSYATLNEAKLKGATLQGATLFGADLPDADLSGADLSGADLRWTELRGANLRSCYGITNEQLVQQTSFLKGATMPNGQKYEDWLKGRGEDGENP